MKFFSLILFLVTSLVSQSPHPTAKLETTEGTIEIRLFPSLAPKAVTNFIELSRENYYRNTVFHRVIEGFMIQGGDPTGTGTGGQSIYGVNFEDETDPSFRFDRPFLLAMANRGPKTNGSQFFITVAPAPWLNGKHTIFGEVTSGFDVLKRIETAPKVFYDSSKPLEPKKTINIEISP